MIDYFSYKKIYTDGELFTLSGKDFVGHAQYKDGIATNYNTGDVLEPKNTFATDLFTSRYFKDRTVDDNFISLPVAESECTFSLNETLNFKSFKYKLDKLKKNNTFVYSQLFIASNRLPVAESITYDAINPDTGELDNYKIGLGESVFGNPDFTTASEGSDLNALGYVEDITAQTNYDFSDRFALFCAADSSFISLTGDSDGLRIIEKSEDYESTPNNIQKFKKLGGVASNSKFLFVSDTIENIIIKYDITGYVNNDTALANIRYLASVMGGTGFTDRRANFNNPTKLACTEDMLAVYDSSNECVKVYNIDLDYLTTLTFINLRKAKGGIETFRAMAFDPHFKNLYILTSTDSNNIILYRADINTRNIEVVNVADELGDDEVVRSITFSQTDSNYWYYSTNKRIFKKYKTRPTVKSVGSYDEERLGDVRSTNIGTTSNENRWNKQNTVFNNTVFPWNFKPTTTTINTTDVEEGLAVPGQKFRAFNIVPGLPGNEKILLFTKSRIYHFDEPVTQTYQKVLNKTNYENYGVNGFSLSPEEYIQPAVLNSELYKLVYDLLTLKNNIVGRFAGKYNYKNELVLDNYNYNIDFASLKRENIEDYFIHHNEESIVGALNRIFQQIYSLQRFIVSAIQIDIGTQVREIEAVSEPPVEQKANLILTKVIVDPQDKYFVGDTVKYRITLSNNGNITAPGVRLQDSLQDIVITEDQRGILTSAVDVNVGDVIEATYTYTIVAPGQVTNNITALGDNPASSSVTITADSNTTLSFNKTLVSQPDVISVGTVLSYKLEVTNDGAAASGVIVEDSEQGSIQNITGELFDGIATIPDGGRVTTTYEYVVQEKDIGKLIINTATLTAEAATGGAQIRLTDTATTGSVTTAPTANLTMTKNIVNEPSTISVGDKLTYQVRVINDGDGAASILVLTDSLNVINVRGTGKNMLTTNGLTSLGSGDSVTVTYDYVVRESDIGNKINNTATLTATLNVTGNTATLTKTVTTSGTVVGSQPGEEIFTQSGNFIVPNGVTSVSVVLVGSGKGDSGHSEFGGVVAYGSNGNTPGGYANADGGGTGGTGGPTTVSNNSGTFFTCDVGCGGGAAGYTGNGGNAGVRNNVRGKSGTGGGGAGGTFVRTGDVTSGGGVGLLGEGTSGTECSATRIFDCYFAEGGSGGANGGGYGMFQTNVPVIAGGSYGGGYSSGMTGCGGPGYNIDSDAGGGGGLAWKNNIPVTPGSSLPVTVDAGGNGAVRIIWGPNRAFPSTNTGII